MTHSSAFSDDNSAQVSFIPSVVLVPIHLNEKTQMEHNGQNLCHHGEKWRKRCITQRFSGGLAAGKWLRWGGTQSLDGKSGSTPLIHLDSLLPLGQSTSSMQWCNPGYCISCMKASIFYDLMCLNRKYLLTVSSKSLRREELVQRYVGPLYLMMTNFVWPVKMKQLDLPSKMLMHS